jgi:hypothetical protein
MVKYGSKVNANKPGQGKMSGKIGTGKMAGKMGKSPKV